MKELLAGIPQVTPTELNLRLERGENIFLLDVREQHERAISHIGGEHIPMGSITSRIDEIPRDREVLVYCRSGARSQSVAQELKLIYGFTEVSNLAGGILRWSDEVDQSVIKY